MKKFLTIMLSLVLSLSIAVLFTSCDMISGLINGENPIGGKPNGGKPSNDTISQQTWEENFEFEKVNNGSLVITTEDSNDNKVATFKIDQDTYSIIYDFDTYSETIYTINSNVHEKYSRTSKTGDFTRTYISEIEYLQDLDMFYIYLEFVEELYDEYDSARYNSTDDTYSVTVSNPRVDGENLSGDVDYVITFEDDVLSKVEFSGYLDGQDVNCCFTFDGVSITVPTVD